ncbi:MAG: phosphoribosylformylglycinamidine synthase subunit PurS [Bacillota bacterium]
MEFEARIEIMLKDTVSDPQGQAVCSALRNMGFSGTREVRVGKLIRLRLEAENEGIAHAIVDEMCRKLLANPVIENYGFELGVCK